VPAALPPGKNPVTFELYASSIFGKFIKFVQGVPTEWSPASSKLNTMDGSYEEFKTQ
jgi:hypothetical protein